MDRSASPLRGVWSFGLCVAIAVAIVAQTPPPAPAPAPANAGPDARQALIARVEAAVAGRPDCGWFALDHVVVAFRAGSVHELRAMVADRRKYALAWVEKSVEACERFLPPRQGMAPLLLLLDDDHVVEPKPAAVRAPGQPLPVTSCKLDLVAPESVWAHYQAAWFGDHPPAPWFYDLAVAYVRVHGRLADADDPGGIKLLLRQARTAKKADVDAFVLGCLQGTPGKHEGNWGEADGPVAWATFLRLAPADKKARFLAPWGSVPLTYAERVRAGETDAAARALALPGGDVLGMVTAMHRFLANGK